MDLHRGGGGQLGGCMDLVEVAVDDWEAVLTHEQAVVHQIFTRGAASLEGTIQSGDTILSINGTSLKGKSHVAVVSCLHEARYSKQALVVIWRNEECKRNISDKDCRLQTKGNKLVEACADDWKLEAHGVSCSIPGLDNAA
ncbi:hypothetical protein CCH79_00018604, partial [Gambusia affinis]